MEDSFESICARIQARDYKVTQQRRLILQAFLSNPQQHLSAEDIFGIVKKELPDIGLATVYRTLDLLVEVGIIQQMDFGDGKTRYELNDEEVHHHHHLICLECGKVSEFEMDLLESLEKHISSRTGFKILDHKVKFYGHCKDCSQ